MNNVTQKKVTKNILADIFKLISIPMFIIINYCAIYYYYNDNINKTTMLIILNLFIIVNYLISKKMCKVRIPVNNIIISNDNIKKSKKILINKIRLSSILGIMSYVFISVLVYLNSSLLLVCFFSIFPILMICLEIKDINKYLNHVYP